MTSMNTNQPADPQNNNRPCRHPVAFFGCMYYAAMRPEEVTDLRDINLVSMPGTGWGEFLLTNSQPRSGSQ